MDNPLTEDAWRSLVMRACDDDGTVATEWKSLWARTAPLDDADPSGELRFKTLVIAGLELRLVKEAKNVATSEGGQSIQAQQYYDHLLALWQQYKTELATYAKTLGAWGLVVGVMETTTLTPVPPGYLPDPASPGYLGDPRYRRRWYP